MGDKQLKIKAVIRTSQFPRELLETVYLQIQSKKEQMKKDDHKPA